MKGGGIPVVVCGGFDDLRSSQIRLLEEASKLGRLTVWLWSDRTVRAVTGREPRFPEPERHYFLRSVRFVSEVRSAGAWRNVNALPELPGSRPHVWVEETGLPNAERQRWASAHDVEYRVLAGDQLRGFPDSSGAPLGPDPVPLLRKKVVVTGCYDWLHSGHVRFFEEASTHGDLYVVVGHDANIRLLKGAGHPLFPQEERRYMVGSIRFVRQALVSSGEGWLDADPEIRRIKPDIYAVNDDGDRGGKREYCAQHGLRYLVLNRAPAPGLPRRSSTDLRGF